MLNSTSIICAVLPEETEIRKKICAFINRLKWSRKVTKKMSEYNPNQDNFSNPNKQIK